jgi:Protein of unknown function (DUF3500)
LQDSDTRQYAAPETARRMTAAASAFLSGLTEAQRNAVRFGFGDDGQRRDRSFLPVPERSGLPIGELDDGQRKLAHELIVAGTSMPGYTKVVSVMAMEHVLRALTIARRPQMVLAPLADAEELGYGFMSSLSGRERHAAIIHDRPPPDFATRMVPRIGEVERPDPVFAPEPDYTIGDDERDILSYVRSGPKGLPAAGLGKRQLGELSLLVANFAGRLPDEVAEAEMRRIERAGLGNLAFAWAGSTEPGQRHYFRVQGPTLLIEFDNTQDNGRHIHSVWRDPVNDFGDDVLAGHYRLHHGAPG